jgi:putative hydrolase of the HAD superfamily
LDLRSARTEVVRLALADLGLDSAELSHRIGGIYHERRDQGIQLFPEALETISWFRTRNCKLALLTNGASGPQRSKIRRFGLEDLFDALFIEGEVGFGKPDRRVYELALQTLHVHPSDVWMVGDNLEWDVAEPQKLGIFSIWVDGRGTGNPKLESIRPDRVIRSLSELRH